MKFMIMGLRKFWLLTYFPMMCEVKSSSYGRNMSYNFHTFRRYGMKYIQETETMIERNVPPKGLQRMMLVDKELK